MQSVLSLNHFRTIYPDYRILEYDFIADLFYYEIRPCHPRVRTTTDLRSSPASF